MCDWLECRWGGILAFIIYNNQIDLFTYSLHTCCLATPKEKWVHGKSGCFDRVTLSDDDGRCNHFQQRHHWRARPASAQIRACVAPDTTLGGEGRHQDRLSAALLQ